MPGSTHDPLRKIQAQQPPDSKADIGSALKAARQKRGHTVEAVVSHTRIPKKFIEALESNHFDEFPALAYLRGFLKTYCDYLEIDFDALWKQLQPPAPQEADAALPSAHGDSARKPAKAPARTGAASSHGEGVSGGALAAMAAAVVLALIVALSLRQREKPKAEEPAPTPAALEPMRGASEATVALEFLDSAWVSVQDDGRTVFEGFVPKNSRQEWKSRKSLAFRTNLPAALRMSVNGAKRPLPAPDASGLRRVEVP